MFVIGAIVALADNEKPPAKGRDAPLNRLSVEGTFERVAVDIVGPCTPSEIQWEQIHHCVVTI